jgi:hypothetical protein
MFSKTKMVLAAALVLAIASAAQAGSRDDSDPSGGYAVGPMGQSFNGGSNPAVRPDVFGNSAKVFDYVPSPNRPSRSHKKVNNH